MALVVKDRVKETTTTTGTGTITLAGAADGYQSFAAIGNGNTTYYAIVGDGEWEVGIGTYTSSGTTLSRTTVLESSNSGSLVSFSSGEKQVFCTFPAERMITVDNDGSGSGLDADLLDGTQLSAITHSGDSVALTGDVTGSTTVGTDGSISVSTTLESDHVYALKNEGTTSGTWIASHDDIDSYYEGLSIFFYTNGIAGASTTTLNINGLGAKTIYYNDTSKLTTQYGNRTLIMLYYDATNDRFYCHDFYFSSTDYELRWQSDVIVNNSAGTGVAVHGYQLLMEGIDGKYYPVTEGGSTANTNAVSTAEFKVGGIILSYDSSTDYNAGATLTTNYLWSSKHAGTMEYWNNRDSGWASPELPIYLVGSINANGNFVLDNSSYTSFLTQDLPTSDDGKVYIYIGLMQDNYDDYRLVAKHPMYVYKEGAVREWGQYASNADKLDGVQLSAITHSGDSVSLTGDVTGTTTVASDGSISVSTNIAANVVNANELNVSGNGTTTQYLRSDGDGSFTWATPPDTVYSHPTHPGDDINLDTGALTGATVISDLDFNVTTDTLGHVTDANATYATRTLTAGDIGAQPVGSYVSTTGDTMTGQLVIGNGEANPLELNRSSQVGIEFNDTSVGSRYLGVNGGNLRFGSNLNHGINDRVFTDAYHPNADKWTTARTLSLTGDVTGSTSWDGSGNASITATVANDSHNHSSSTGNFTVGGDLIATDVLPPTDNTGVVGNASYTWSNGQFTSLQVNSTLTVRSYIDLADSDGIRFGSSDDSRFWYNGSTNNFIVEMEAACLGYQWTDNQTERMYLEKATGDLTVSGAVKTNGIDTRAHAMVMANFFG